MCVCLFFFASQTILAAEDKLPYNSENKPRGIYCFFKGLFEGLIFVGASIRRGLLYKGNFNLEIDWACNWREILCSKLFNVQIIISGR